MLNGLGWAFGLTWVTEFGLVWFVVPWFDFVLLVYSCVSCGSLVVSGVLLLAAAFALRLFFVFGHAPF